MKDFLKAVAIGGLFAVPFLTLYVPNEYFFPFITGKNFWFRIIVDVAFAAWIILAFLDVKYRPKISGITWSFGILLVIMFFANLFGVHPESSFWSNFERMDGYVSLVHTFMYMLVLGSMLQTKQMWQRLLITSLTVAFLVALYGLAQYGGMISGSGRIDSRLGNAAYMAVYMLFHIFVAFWLFVESKKVGPKVLYGLLVAMFAFVLIETGTRGTAVGLAVGVMVMVAYIGLFGKRFKEYRKYAIGAFVLLALVIGGFIVGRDSELVQSNRNLARIANISLQDLEIRGIIWGLAWDGVMERPLLGYGQSNFNFVFNKNYDPRLHAQEQWFDRSHNIFMDWLVTGGFLGLIAYLSIFAWCVYYLLIQPILKKDEETFNVLERGVLLGILAGYFTHNLVVFDNIVSYIFFAIILGLITSRVGVVPKKLAKFKVDQAVVKQIVAPVVFIALGSAIYFWYLPGMSAAKQIIVAFQQQDPVERLEAFKTAAELDSFGFQEVTEQLSQQTIGVVRNQNISDEVRGEYVEYTEEQLNRLLEYKPGDARVHVFVGTYYRSIGDLAKAEEQMALARQYSPNKQSIIQQQGFVALSQGKNQEGVEFFKEAFELEEENLEAREYYAASLFYVGNVEKVKELMEADGATYRFASSDFFVSSANQAGQSEFLSEIYRYRVDSEPDGRQSWRTDPQNWATLAYLYYQSGQTEKAVAALEEATVVIPEFGTTATCFADNISNGRTPEEGCQ